MNRRTFLTTALASGLPFAAFANPVPYSPALYRELRRGDDVAVYLFWSSWSLTCGFQRDEIEAIKAANPDYADRLRFVHVDHDFYGESRMAAALKIPRRSTIVVMQGKRELTRIKPATGQHLKQSESGVCLIAPQEHARAHRAAEGAQMRA